MRCRRGGNAVTEREVWVWRSLLLLRCGMDGESGSVSSDSSRGLEGVRNHGTMSKFTYGSLRNDRLVMRCGWRGYRRDMMTEEHVVTETRLTW